MSKEIWHVPQYYMKFSCKAEKCRHTCCSNWRIPVSREEYERLVHMECNDELYRRVQMAFEVPEFVTEERFRYICFNWLGECPLLDKGLCSIHREKGTGLLPKICRLYPRSLKRINGYNIASCSSSCEKVIELLLDSNELSFIPVQLDETPEIIFDVPDDDAEQIKMFQQLIKDRNTTLSYSLGQICSIINKQEFQKDFLSEADPLQAALNVLRRLAPSNERLKETAEPIIERYGSNAEVYLQDAESFEKEFPGWMLFFERVINNSMIYESFPFVDSRCDKTQAYKGLCVCYGLMRIICVGTHAFNPAEDALTDAVSALFHLIDHTAFYYNVHVLVDNAAIMLKL